MDFSRDSGQLCLLELSRLAQTGRCVNSVNHDLNNQLGAVTAFAEILLLDDTLSEDARDLAASLLESALRCVRLVSNLSSLARQGGAQRDMTDLRAVAENVMRLRDYAQRRAKITAALECGDNLPSLCADAARLHLALMCLVLNAEEAVADSAPEERRVRLRLARVENGLKMAVWNAGPGIPPEDREAVFAPFTTTKGGHHAGCGLALARQVAEEHGGTLDYIPEEGFILLLPPGEPGGA